MTKQPNHLGELTVLLLHVSTKLTMTSTAADVETVQTTVDLLGDVVTGLWNECRGCAKLITVVFVAVELPFDHLRDAQSVWKRRIDTVHSYQ